MVKSIIVPPVGLKTGLMPERFQKATAPQTMAGLQSQWHSEFMTLKPRQTDEARLERLRAKFTQHFGHDPVTAVRAPGRVDLMGSHTDYNDGLVLTVALDRDIWMLAKPRQDHRIRLLSVNLDTTAEISVTQPHESPLTGWGSYVQGVAVELYEAGYPLTGCDVLVHGTIPLGGGLSSSAALEATTATLFEHLGGYALDPVEKALLCQRAENRWVGVNCGVLDQYSSILGAADRALILDCRTLTHKTTTIPESVSLVICDTCAPRQLRDSEYDNRRRSCEAVTAWFAARDSTVRALRDLSLTELESQAAAISEEGLKRAKFVIEENDRVMALATALEQDDRTAMARLARASFEGARDLYEITVPAMEFMMEAMLAAPGVIGCRQAGGGFGGCLVALVEHSQRELFAASVESNYASSSGLKAEVHWVGTSRGAGTVEL